MLAIPGCDDIEFDPAPVGKLHRPADLPSCTSWRIPMSLSRMGFAALIYSMLALVAPTLSADLVFNVDTVADSIDDNVNDAECHTSANRCSLRAAIMQASHLTTPGLTSVNLPAGTYYLRPISFADDETNGDLNLTPPLGLGQQVAIFGAGAATTIIDAVVAGRGLSVGPGRVASIHELTIRNGFPLGAGRDFGGGISNEGVLSISRCVIEGNSNLYGGGIYSSGHLEIVGSTIRSNAASFGGGVYSQLSTTTIRDTTVYGNTASDGAGILTGNFLASDYLYLVNTTLSGNRAQTDGGAIYQFNGTIFMYNSSVVGNKADVGLTGASGGGLYIKPGARFGLVNTVMVRNAAGFDSNNDCVGAVEAYGRNLVGDPATVGCSASNAPLGPITRSTVGPLQDNGGTTLTHALLAGSEAINASLLSLGCVDYDGFQLIADQRGALHLTGERCDLGSFEYGASIPGQELIFRDGFQAGANPGSLQNHKAATSGHPSNGNSCATPRCDS